jgi:hypothetical protein
VPFSAKKQCKNGLAHSFFCNDEVFDCCQDLYLLGITDFGAVAVVG